MSLLDPKLPWILFSLLVLTFITTIIYWPKFSRRSAISITARISLILATNLLAISTVGVFLNNYGDFYTSWQELFGKAPTVPIITDKASSVISKDDLIHATITTGGSAIFHRMVTGDTTGISAEVIVVVPPSYLKALQSGAKSRSDYRVIEYFPGYPGHPQAWVHGMKIIDRQDEKYAQGKMPEVITVLPRINVYPKIDAECMDLPKGPQIESWITKDVYNFANRWLKLNPSRWAVVGYSTGGWCSTMLTLRHPDQYSIAASIAGYFTPQVAKQESAKVRVALKKFYDINSIVENNPPAVSLYIVNSLNDKLSHASTVSFLGKLKSPIKSTEVVLEGAGHNFVAWKQLLPSLLDWIGVQFNDKNLN